MDEEVGLDADCGDEPVMLSALLEGLHIESRSCAPSFDSPPVLNEISGMYDGTPFDEIAVTMKPITSDGGVLKAVSRCGQLSRGLPPMDDPDLWILVKYTAYLEGNLEPFDVVSSPRKFWPDREDLLPGFRVALGSMFPLERSLYIFKPDYFYGELGCEPRIPSGGCAALFDIQVLDHGVSKLPSNKSEGMCLADKLALVNKMHIEGTSFYNGGQFAEAARAYGKAIDEMESISARDQAERDEIDRKLLPLYLNAQQTCLLRGRYAHAVTLGKSALNIDENNIKALYRLGVAYRHLAKYKVAEYYLHRALKIEPSNKEIIHQISALKVQNNK